MKNEHANVMFHHSDHGDRELFSLQKFDASTRTSQLLRRESNCQNSFGDPPKSRNSQGSSV